MRCRILLVGFGNVGREFARLVLERRSELAKVHGLDAAIVGIITGRHGSVERARGSDLRKALRLADAGASLESCGRGVHGRSAEYIRRARADVVIEITPLRIAPRQIGVDHIVAAISSGKHVITANKGPVVYHYRRLKEIARTQGLGFRHEGARSARKRMKLIARGWRDGRSVKASVSLEAVALDHPLASVDGTSSSLVVRTDMLRELQIIERQPTLRQTAYALYSDLLAIHEGRLSP